MVLWVRGTEKGRVVVVFVYVVCYYRCFFICLSLWVGLKEGF